MSQADVLAVLGSWKFSPFVCAWILVVGFVYLRGWIHYRRKDAVRYSRWRLASFWAGLATVWFALQSPLDVLAAFSLQIHMVQHLLLMLVAPPLILLSAPTLPLIAGLPKTFRQEWVVPFATWRPLRFWLAQLFRPRTTWTLFVLTLWLWHVPAVYELAIESDPWHRAEHACFLVTSILFWWPIIQPFPSRAAGSRWQLVPYLILAGVQGTVLAGFLTFSDRVWYPHYGMVPIPGGLDPLTDQALAGAIMWIPMSLAFLTALVCVVGTQITGRGLGVRRPIPGPWRASVTNRRREAIPWTGCSGVRWITSRPVRTGLRWTLWLLAIVVIVDGWTGPQVSSVNLAGVLPWIHWRGLLVVTLLLGGNFFCGVCPFTSLRSQTKRWFSPTRAWPRPLRNKWSAVAILAIFFWAYEAFALWDRPFVTAWITLGFFATAFAFDAIFANAPFCKFVCPIGQFNFVNSLISPTEIAVTDANVCSGCHSRDCIRGNDSTNGCQTLLFQPRKRGNMDCTFCFDCVDACPHGNVALVPLRRASAQVTDRVGGTESASPRHRPDLSALIVLVFFASLVNAAWMIGPVIDWEERLVRAIGWGQLPVRTGLMALALVGIPALIVWVVARFSSSGTRGEGVIGNLARFAPSLVPLGFGMWLAHYTFHLFTSADSAWVASRRAWADWTGGHESVDRVVCACGKADAIPWLLPMEFLFVGVGLCASFVLAYRVAGRHVSDGAAPSRQWVPWTILMMVFYAACLWVLAQPMQMRGASMMAM